MHMLILILIDVQYLEKMMYPEIFWEYCYQHGIQVWNSERT